LFLYDDSQVVGVAFRKSSNCFSANPLPPGFGGRNLSLPRATRETFLPLNSIFPLSRSHREARKLPTVARQVGGKAKELLALPGFSGEVLAVLSGTIYLSAPNGEILWICPEGSPLHRRGILVSQSPPVLPGDRCFVEFSGLTFAGGPSVVWQGAAEWKPFTPGSEEVDSRVSTGARFRQLLAVLDLLEIPDGLGPSISLVSALAGGRTRPSFSPGSLMERVKDRIGGLAQDCRRQDLGSVMLRGREVVGLGPGLTPSGDDFLGALLFAAHCLQRAYPINFSRAEADRSGLLDWARTRTHPISYAIFSDLVMGHGPGALHELVHILLRGREGPFQAVNAAIRLAKIGHSSGWDMLAGFLTGMLMVEHKE